MGEKPALKIVVVGATGLRKSDMHGLKAGQPYCVIEVNGQSWRTPVCKDTTSPLWNYEFETQDYALGHHMHFSVYDEDYLKKDDLLGVHAMSCAVWGYPHGFNGEVALKESGNQTARLRLQIGPLPKWRKARNYRSNMFELPAAQRLPRVSSSSVRQRPGSHTSQPSRVSDITIKEEDADDPEQGVYVSSGGASGRPASTPCGANYASERSNLSARSEDRRRMERRGQSSDESLDKDLNGLKLKVASVPSKEPPPCDGADAGATSIQWELDGPLDEAPREFHGLCCRSDVCRGPSEVTRSFCQ